MSSGPVELERPDLIQRLGQLTLAFVQDAGQLALFTCDLLAWLLTHRWRRSVLVSALYQIGYESIPVVITTGGFIGMVMAVQSYDQLRYMHLETNLGAVINI